ncbi:MAG TPA: hypothetical protein VHI52_00215 [Verrucomicrobiae bacterium]|nr:hypothetical protein [Verrucomicrobiae bacterium]
MGLVACGAHQGGGAAGPKADTPVVVAAGGVDTAFRTVHVPVPFAGLYVNEEYVDKIRANRSPRLDQGVEKSCLEIPDSTLKPAMWVYGFHEGGGDVAVVKQGDRYWLYDTYGKKLADTIEVLSPGELRIGKIRLRKLKYGDREKNDWGVLEEILFSGRYRTEDGKEVEFGADGHVKGLEDTLSYYAPFADYVGPGGEVDQLGLGQSPEHNTGYAFRFDKDTLFICQLDHGDYDTTAHDGEIAEMGKVVWKLQKVQ